MHKRTRGRVVAALAVLAVGSGAASAAAAPVSHVLLISVDGLHQTDLEFYVHNHPASELAKLVNEGVQYANARTPIPSDSFPGMVAQVTGGNPASTGVYYDASYNHALLPPGASCTPGQTTGLGGEVEYAENIDLNKESIDAGQGLSGLPGTPFANEGIMNLTGNPQTLINPASLPIDPTTCKVVYPHEYLKVNTVFNVAREHGLQTAWADKHPAYEILDGPNDKGIQDLFTPEINSNAVQPDGTPYGGDWTAHNDATRQYDSYKVQAVLNEIRSYNHSGNEVVGVPAIFGMNFQTISTAEKLPASEATVGGPVLNGGYLPGTTTPGPLLSNALEWLDGRLEMIDNELAKQGLSSSTAIILSAKHGQSPQDPKQLVRIKDGMIIEALDAAWAEKYPSAPPLVAAATNDDALMMWLSNRSTEAAKFASKYLMSHSATGNTYNEAEPTKPGPEKTLGSSGLTKVYTGAAAAKYFGVPANDPRHPDVWGVVQQGVVYTGGTKKIAEHGGANTPDRAVALIVDAPGVVARTVKSKVETTQIAPTILQLLGLSPEELQAVQQEHTPVLPKIG